MNQIKSHGFKIERKMNFYGNLSRPSKILRNIFIGIEFVISVSWWSPV